MSEHPVTVTAFDHLVLRCANLETTLTWYLDQLGLAPVRVDEWRRGEVPFPSARVDDHTIIDFVKGDHGEGRLEHLCLVIAPTDLEQLAREGGFDVLEGPVRRYGARGDGTSLYVRDPEGTTIELRHYGDPGG